jgi:hypothetical protein
MRVLLGSALLVAFAAACADDGDNDTAAGSSDTTATSDTPPSSEPTPTPSTSDTPPTTEAEPPLRRPKPNVPLPVTPPPIKPPSGPTDRLKPITLIGVLVEPVPGCMVVEAASGRWELAGTLPEGVAVGDRVEVTGCPAPEVEGSCGSPVVRVRSVRPA